MNEGTICCDDCGEEIVFSKDIEDNEILSCNVCGREYLVKIIDDKIVISTLEIESEDWGE